MQRNLATWSLSVAAFEDMVDTRRRAYEQRMPGLQQTLDTVDLDALEAHKNELESRLKARSSATTTSPGSPPRASASSG